MRSAHAAQLFVNQKHYRSKILTPSELNKYRTVLYDKRAETSDGNRSRGTVAIEPTADEMDRTQGAQERDLAIGAFDRSAKLLHDLQSALGRIQTSTFIIRVNCECDISQRRLAAAPWASSCIVCQEEAHSRVSEPLRHAA